MNRSYALSIMRTKLCANTRLWNVAFYSWAVAALENSTRATTPVEQSLAPRETITVTDPGHPFYGHKLQLVGLVTTARAEQRCIVLTPTGCELRLPLALTDLMPEPPTRYSLPLNINSVKRLLSAYQRVLSQLKEREDAQSNHRADATRVEAHNTPTAVSAGTDRTSPSLAATVGDPAASSATNAHRRLPQYRQTDSKPRGRRGGA
jgi:hypothetical protein